MTSTLDRALTLLEGFTFKDSEHLAERIKELSNIFPTLTSEEWLEILNHIQFCLRGGFSKEHKAKDKHTMKLKITSKAGKYYDLYWTASIEDFTSWLAKTDSCYVNTIDTWENKVLLKISEIEAITIWED